MRVMSHLCRPFAGSLLFIAQASQLPILSKILRLGVVGSSGLCRLASLKKETCRRLAMLIALCLMFSLVPVAGSQIAAIDATVATESTSSSLTLRLHHVWPNHISARDVGADAMAENAGAPELVIPKPKVFSSALADCAQSQSARRTSRALPKPCVDDPPVDGITSKQSQGTGGPEGSMDCGVAGPAIRQELAMQLADAKLLSADKGVQSLIARAYMKLKRRLQSMEEVAEGKTIPKKGVSHGLIRVKPIRLLKAVEENDYPGLADHLENQSEKNARLAASHDMFRENKHSEQGSSKLMKLDSLGETREKEQIRKVVETLRKSGLFAAVAGIIEGMNLWMLPQFVTIFVPTDSAYQTVKQADIDQLALFQYHTVIQRYAFNQLCEFKEGTILYTMRPGYSIVVTEKQSPFKISLDDVFVIAPDLYLDESISVHGIDGIFNATRYGRSLDHGKVPEVAAPPAVEAPSNVTGKQLNPPFASPPAQAGPGNATSAAQPGSLNQGVNSGNDNTNPPRFSFSPLASETASDLDASDRTVSARFGASYHAALVFVSALLCYY